MLAISLFSGGLDSQLAVKLIQEQGIEVIGVNFRTPFFGGGAALAAAARQLGIRLEVQDCSQEYLEVLRHPRYGYGKNMNPCIDCHGFMLRKACALLPELGARFVITGEVLGQRPMSQTRSSLAAVEKLSGCRGLVLRPLSARLLPPTVPELEGWVDRERLLDISGRSRKRQMELAQQYGLQDYPSPAGGCLLTNEGYARRLRRLLALAPECDAEAFDILRHGRLFSPGPYLLAVGRKAEENQALAALARPGDYLLKVRSHPGPLGVLRPLPSLDEAGLEAAAALVARYSDAAREPRVTVRVWQPGGSERLLEVTPLKAEETPPAL
ncbi:MAG: tRNA 4-thiouridine(8) synthase ThiI [Syntrophomonadaceae bacterium]|nr:tRNA 4-thiouridine(8) synthase ThiI [Syntrophomonadaceae bacterium]